MRTEDYIRSIAPRWYVVLLRLFMGAFYIRLAIGRILAVEADPATVKTRIAGYESAGQFEWFRWYLTRAIDPHLGSYFLAALWVAAPLMLGAALALGLFTRISAALGCLWLAHAWVIRFHSANPTDLMMLELQFAVLLVLCFAAAGRTLGVDGIWWERRMIATFPGDVATYRPPRIPIFKETEPIPLSDTKPGKIVAKPDEKP